MAFCKSCGTRLGSGQRKCPNCGRASGLGASLSGVQRPLRLSPDDSGSEDPQAAGAAEETAPAAEETEPAAAEAAPAGASAGGRAASAAADPNEISVDIPEEEVAEIGEPAEVDVTQVVGLAAGETAARAGDADGAADGADVEVTHDAEVEITHDGEVEVTEDPEVEITDGGVAVSEGARVDITDDGLAAAGQEVEVEDVTGDVPEVPAEETQPPRPQPRAKARKGAGGPAKEGSGAVTAVRVGAEDLRGLIAERPEMVERGLRRHQADGVDLGENGGLATDVGEIHLLAEDAEGDLVVVRVAEQGAGDPVGPVLEQMGWVSKHLAGEDRGVRAIVLMEPPATPLGYAARAVAGSVRFKTWRVTVSVEDVEV